LGLVCGEELEETASTVISAKQSTFAAEVMNAIQDYLCSQELSRLVHPIIERRRSAYSHTLDLV
jgi:hypothetical protein